MSDFLEDKKKEIAARLEELRPLVDEFRRLEAAAAALDGVGREPARAPARRAATPAASRRTNGEGSESRGRGRPKGTGTRSKQALGLVRDRPGITIPELADAMDIKQNYLYRVMPELQKDGLVRKEGRGWHALEAA
jgi:CRP-like cAMP-binding protein